MEADLIRRAAQGDAEAFEALVRQHEQIVFRLAYLIVGDADDAQDIAQETFIRAYHALPHFDTERPLRPWLLQITRNLARNRRRALGRYAAALTRAFRSAPQTTHSAEAEHVQRGDVQALWDAIRTLDARDQEIIYLRYMLELPVAETADILNVEPGTVKSRLSRALTRLRGVVEADFPLLAEGRRP